MQISVTLILLAALNVAYVISAQQNINSNDVYDVHNVNKDAGPWSGIVGENYGSVDFVPWAEANDVKYELEQFSGTISIFICAFIPFLFKFGFMKYE